MAALELRYLAYSMLIVVLLLFVTRFLTLGGRFCCGRLDSGTAQYVVLTVEFLLAGSACCGVQGWSCGKMIGIMGLPAYPGILQLVLA